MYETTEITICKIASVWHMHKRWFGRKVTYYNMNGVLLTGKSYEGGDDCKPGEYYLLEYSLKDNKYGRILWDRGKQPRSESLDSLINR